MQALRDKLAKAEADAAVMREALTANEWHHGECGEECAVCEGAPSRGHRGDCVVSRALATNAGEALLDELTALRARVAELEAPARHHCPRTGDGRHCICWYGPNGKECCDCGTPSIAELEKGNG